jgi:hypothetical protein
MHCPLLHLSLVAHSLSDPHLSMQMPSLQAIPCGHATSLTHVVGMRTHSTSVLPVKEAWHEHTFLWPTVSQSAFTPHADSSVQGSRQVPPAQISLLLQLRSDTHADFCGTTHA